jgi:hypothetical protein
LKQTLFKTYSLWETRSSGPLAAVLHLSLFQNPVAAETSFPMEPQIAAKRPDASRGIE